MAVQLRRDPFARATLMREKAPAYTAQNGCGWCGKLGSQYRYYWETDGGTRYPDGHRYCRPESKHFCSVGCWRDYNRD